MSGIGIAVVGFGHWGAKLARVIDASSRFDLVAIVDADPARRLAAAAHFPGVAIYDAIESVFAIERAISVAIATPPLTLFALTRTAIANGRHVFVEKPGSSTQIEALTLAEEAKRARLKLVVDLTPVWSPLQDAMATALAAGAVGQLKFWRAERVNVGYGQPGIDVLRDLAIHDLAVLAALVVDRPVCFGLKGVAQGADGRLYAATMRVDYESGFAAEIAVSWIGKKHLRRTTLIGSGGALLRDDVNCADGLYVTSGDAHLRQSGAKGTFLPAGLVGEPLSRAIEGFADCIEAGAPARADAMMAGRLLDWIESAERSCFDSREAAPRLTLLHDEKT